MSLFSLVHYTESYFLKPTVISSSFWLLQFVELHGRTPSESVVDYIASVHLTLLNAFSSLMVVKDHKLRSSSVRERRFTCPCLVSQ